MLRSMHDQKTRRDGWVSPQYKRDLLWWRDTLQSRLCERRDWNPSVESTVQMFCDARGSPAHLGAVLLIDDKCFFTHVEPARDIVEMFRPRRDKQIMGLELLSISLGLCTFRRWLKKRNVIIHSDNTGSEVWFLACCHL